MFDYEKKYLVEKNNILYKCGWSPVENIEFKGVITHVFVNGNLAFDNGNISTNREVLPLKFNIS